MIICTLSSLSDGQTAVVDRIDLNDLFFNRLNDLGIYSGSALCRCYAAPSGSPIAFSVKQSLISLRRKDCDHIYVRLEK